MHIVRSTSLKYSKIRQFQEHFQFDVCRHEVRYGCLREDSCHFAHSFIELKVWLLQQYSGGGLGGGRPRGAWSWLRVDGPIDGRCRGPPGGQRRVVTGEGGSLRRSPCFLDSTEEAKAQLSGSCQARGMPLRALHVEKEEAGRAGPYSIGSRGGRP